MEKESIRNLEEEFGLAALWSLVQYWHAAAYLAQRSRYVPPYMEVAIKTDCASRYIDEAAEIVGIGESNFPLSDVLSGIVSRLISRGPEEENIQLRVIIKRIARRLKDLEGRRG